jgi:hypothetical protein
MGSSRFQHDSNRITDWRNGLVRPEGRQENPGHACSNNSKDQCKTRHKGGHYIGGERGIRTLAGTRAPLTI